MTRQDLQTFDGVVRGVTLSGTKNGPLAGLRFAAKDLFDVEGYVTGAGNLEWERTHAPATETAPAIVALLENGASLAGKSCTDELAFSMDGINVHFGVPVNPQDGRRIPGGSSSGSASMVASEMVDFALGTDTAGSVRVPASFCGIFGMRPTHGRISTEGVVALAPSFDTVGWFARRASLLSQVGSVLLQEKTDLPLNLEDVKLVVMKDLFATVDPTIRDQLMAHLDRMAKGFGKVGYCYVSVDKLYEWAERFRYLQAWDVWREHGEWISSRMQHFDPQIASRFQFASTVTDAQHEQAFPVRAEVLRTLQWLLPGNALLCLPPTTDLPPLLTDSKEEFDDTRKRNYARACIASLSGAPQVTLPFRLASGFKVGISFVGLPGRDALLLKTAELVEASGYTNTCAGANDAKA